MLGLWDGNPVKLDCYDHYTTTDGDKFILSNKKRHSLAHKKSQKKKKCPNQPEKQPFFSYKSLPENDDCVYLCVYISHNMEVSGHRKIGLFIQQIFMEHLQRVRHWTGTGEILVVVFNFYSHSTL